MKVTDKMRAREAGSASCTLEQKPHAIDNADGLGGVFNFEHWRGGKCIYKEEFNPNLIVNEGKNKLLGVMFVSETQLTTWFIGLIDNSGFSSIAVGDDYDGINDTNGWSEFASYTDPANGDSATTRPAWTPGTPSSQSVTNGTVVSFDITGAGTVKGIFLAAGTNAQTKSDSTASGNFLWCATTFTGGDRIVANLDVLKISYTVNS